MNNLIQESMSRSIGDVRTQIAGIDEKLADLFGRIAEIMAKDRYKGERPSYPISGKVVEDILRDIGGGRRINTIPFGEPTRECLEECLVIAYGKIKSKNGFIKITKKVNDYWLNCGVVNSRTLIFTDCWDIAEFNSWFRESCNKYTSSGNRNNVKHTVGIALYGDYGFSLQYLR